MGCIYNGLGTCDLHILEPIPWFPESCFQEGKEWGIHQDSGPLSSIPSVPWSGYSVLVTSHLMSDVEIAGQITQRSRPLSPWPQCLLLRLTRRLHDLLACRMKSSHLQLLCSRDLVGHLFKS